VKILSRSLYKSAVLASSLKILRSRGVILDRNVVSGKFKADNHLDTFTLYRTMVANEKTPKLIVQKYEYR
jgi:hypothetical protein